MGAAASLCIGGEPPGRLFVVLVHFNPAGFARRDALLEQCYMHLVESPEAHRLRIITAELARPGQRFATDALGLGMCVVRQLKFTSPDVFWAKENLINAAARCAMEELGAGSHDGIAWVDADVVFRSPSWISDTLAALNKSDFVQLFERAELLGPDGETTAIVNSFGGQHVLRGGGEWRQCDNSSPLYWHPGFA